MALVGPAVAGVVLVLMDARGEVDVLEIVALAEPREVEADGCPPHRPWDSLKAKRVTINPSMDEILLSEAVLALIAHW